MKGAAAFAFALGVATAVGLGVGLIPAVHASRGDLHGGLQQASRRAAGGHQWTRQALVVAEVALALVLLAGAGLLFRSLQRLFAVDAGFDASHVLTMQVQTSGHRFDDDRATHEFFAQALEAVRRVPGVRDAAFTSQLPLTGDVDTYGVHFESSPNDKPQEDHGAFRYAVTPGYVETIGIPLRRGRLRRFLRVALAVIRDEGRAADAVQEAFATAVQKRRQFRGEGPLGAWIWRLDVNAADAVYVTTAQWRFADRALWLVVRTLGDHTALAPAIKNAIWSVDKEQPIVRVASMDSLLAASAAERRFALVLFEAFALVALALAATGIYGVLSGSVAERTREIGVRSALGASRADILALVVGQGMTLAGLGALIGLGGAVAASGALVTLLFGVSRLDPTTYAGVVALLLAVSGMACALPAWRAARVDPSITLRAE